MCEEDPVRCTLYLNCQASIRGTWQPEAQLPLVDVSLLCVSAASGSRCHILLSQRRGLFNAPRSASLMCVCAPATSPGLAVSVALHSQQRGRRSVPWYLPGTTAGTWSMVRWWPLSCLLTSYSAVMSFEILLPECTELLYT